MVTIGDCPDGVTFIDGETNIYKYRNFIVVAKTKEGADGKLKSFLEARNDVKRFYDDFKDDEWWVKRHQRRVDRNNELIQTIEENLKEGSKQISTDA